MGLDLLIVTPVIILSLLGFRDGMVRKLVSVVMMIIAMVVAQTYRADVGKMLGELFGIDVSFAPTMGFLTIFFGIVFVQSLLYRLLTANYKIGGIADRSLGSILGFFQGMLLVSVLLMIFALEDVPSKQAKMDSRLYKSVVNIAPQIMDFASSLIPEATQRIDELTRPDIQTSKK